MIHHLPTTRYRWRKLLTLILTLMIPNAWAELTVATQQLSSEDLATIDQDREIEVIIEFDQSEAINLAQQRRRQAGIGHDNAAILVERAESYRRQKEHVLANLAGEAVTLRRSFSHLPVVTAKVRSAAVLRTLLRQTGVKAVYSNVKLRHMLAQSLPLIRQPETQAQGGAGAGTMVVVLDTGVDYTKAAFGSCAAAGGACPVAYAEDFAGNDDQLDDNGHGTNVAGIILGVAPATKIAALDVFRRDGFAYSDDIIDAINWAIANKTTHNIVAMNLSLGGNSYSSPCASNLFATPIANARAAGILAAVASGNEGKKDAIGSPACVPAAVSVGAVYDSAQGSASWSNCTDRATQADQVTCFSNSTGFLTLLAPGATISAAGINMSGTSQATPHVAGAIAVLRAAYPNESLDATIARLSNTGIPVTDVNGITKPRIDLLSAYTANRTAYSLTVNKAGTGSGLVNSQPAAIDCGTQCSAEFSAGTTITLTATPSSGSTFVRWSGDCAGTNACTVTMDGAHSVTAHFNTVGGLSLGEALDNTVLNWRTTGDAGWQGVALSDRDAARSGAISDGQASNLYTSVTGPGTLAFQWQVSSEPGHDVLELLVDGVAQFTTSGQSAWESRTVAIGAGVHDVQWTYRKDGSIAEGEDAGWVDAVTFTATQSRLPDLSVTQITSPTNGTPGGMIEVSATVTNQGDTATGAFWLAFLLSNDAVIGLDDVDTGWGCAFDTLAGGATATCSGQVGIPATTAPGNYYLGAYADAANTVLEGNETNNSQASRSITIANNTFSLVVARTGLGTGKVTSSPAGIDCGNQCNAQFAADSVVTLVATPEAGATFAGWSGDCAGSSACTVNMNAARTVTALFNRPDSGNEIFPQGGLWPAGWTTPSTAHAPWTLASDWAKEGRYSLHSERIGHSQKSQVQVSGDFQAGTVSFTFYLSSEIEYDWLTFSIDGVEQNGWSGEGERTVSFPLTTGYHTLQWSYEKDDSVSSGSDRAWIDEVLLPAIRGGNAATTLITHYYVSILRRSPEADGLAYWQQQIADRQAQGLDAKPVFRDMAGFFFNSPEYLGRNTTNTEFITNLYLTFFRRDPDADGRAFWLDQLASGMTRNDAMAGFLYSPEFTDFMQELGL